MSGQQRRRLGVGPAGTDTAAAVPSTGARLLPVELAELGDDQEHAELGRAATPDNPGLSPRGRRELGRGGGR
ncbi:hypothetical protein [Embleya sp. NPDC005575]|uniref:hypothetical protein n=1 Tax=Embleya sp. NPDC005575 TaxID=3156892 RepID=UPI0033B478C1